ncbi:MAG TPA: single-stranded-DNA-specific exonuclease RecJ [Cyclobacteriaceae bacterium]|nr:single-stranded-DNA-specific exonuclease RecJ [Cyclobacteriaceae bacterium]
MVKRWRYRPIPPSSEVSALSKAINVNEYLCAILIQRGITDFELAKKFFRPSLDHLHDPFLMRDMDQAVTRIKQAIDNKEKILIYGDYDVDGTTAVSLVYRFLKSFYEPCEFYIPDRYSEGYGVSEKGIQWAEDNGFTLIIALDLGIKSSDMVKAAGHKGIDFIICDHHLPGKDMPSAVAVLDPKREDCEYPFQELSGCGIGFKLIQAFARRYGKEEELYSNLDLVAVSIASDIVPIDGENRILAHFGLKKLNENPSPGLRALKEIAAIKNDLDISGVVFTLGPRINAAGRVDHADGAVELLIASSQEEAAALAEKVNVNNDLRREFDSNITEEAVFMIENDEFLRTSKSTVLFKNSWHKGVIGIVAARCVEKFYRPTVILTESNDLVTGSARSVNGFNLYNAIAECSDLLEKYGGHKYAAGLTMKRENLEAFRAKFEEVVCASLTEEMLTPVVDVDLVVPFDAITRKFIHVLRQLAPFGPENHNPVFEARNVYVLNSLSTFKDRHLRFLAGQKGQDNIFNAVGFDMMEHHPRMAAGDHFRMTFTIEENTYNGMTSIQLRIKDIKFD